MSDIENIDLSQVCEVVVTEGRRSCAERSILKFARLYLGHYFNDRSSRMHVKIATLLRRASQDRGARLAVAAPRGHAKTTLVTTAYVLWSICHSHEKFIVLISDSGDQARALLEPIRDELTNNELLRRDFPHVCEPADRRPPPSRWAADEIITRNGIRVTALGCRKRVRGLKQREHRPSLIILDDVESDEGVRSREQRIKLKSWFGRAIGNLGVSDTNIVVVGTVLHYDSLLSNLLDAEASPSWTGLRYRAVEAWSPRRDLWESWELVLTRRQTYNELSGPKGAKALLGDHHDEMLEGTKVLWPARENYASLMLKRVQIGRGSFDAEMQNEPVNADDCYFKPTDLHFWDDEFINEHALVSSFKNEPEYYLGCDPALGRGGGDLTAIVVVAKDLDTDRLYVLRAIAAKLNPDETIAMICKMNKCWGFRRIGIESNGFQEVMTGLLKKRLREGPRRTKLIPIISAKNKDERIHGLQAPLADGSLMLSHQHTELLDQLRHFPLGVHDDAADALEMATAVALDDLGGRVALINI